MLSPLDRDMIIRTLIGEAGGEPDEGQRAAANVILNRMKSGKYGGEGGTDVVLYPNAFEAWNNPHKLLGYSADSPEYSKASAALDAAMNEDATGGAVNFLNPELQKKLGRKMPDWAPEGKGQRIGNHVFYGGTQVASDADDPFEDVFGAATPQGPPANDDPFEDVFGGKAPAAQTEAAPGEPGAPVVTPSEIAPDTGRAFAGAVAEGIPIAGPVIKSGMDKGLAWLRAQRSGRSFADELKAVQDMDAADKAAHPIATKAGEVTGGILSLGAGGATTIGGKMLGIAGKNLLQRSLASTATGALLGGGDAAVREGPDKEGTYIPGRLGAVTEGALLGGATGAVGPAVGDIVGAGVGKGMDWIKSVARPSKKAGNKLLEVMRDSGKSVGDIEAELGTNPRLAPVDVDPNLRAQAMGVATQIGPGRSVIADAIEKRVAGQKGAVREIFDDAIEQTPDVKKLVEGLEKNTRDNARKGFGDALRDADPVDISGVLKAIDEKVSPGVLGVTSPGIGLPRGAVAEELAAMRGDIANASEMQTSPQLLHEIQSEWGKTARDMVSSADRANHRVGRAIMKVREKLIDAIDEATGGAFKPAQAKFKEDWEVRDAFTKGMDMFKNRLGEAGLEDRPEYWKAWIDKATPEELDAAKKGVRVAVDQVVGRMRWAARKGAELVEPELNQDKLAALLGADEAKAMAKRIADELKINQSNAELMKGSMTAPRQAAAEGVRVRDWEPKKARTDTTLTGLLTYMPERAGRAAGRAAVRSHDQKRNKLIAEALMDPAKFGPAVRSAERREAARLATAKSSRGIGNVLVEGEGQRRQGNRRRKPLQITITKGAN